MRTNITLATALEAVVLELRAKGEPAEAPSDPEWKCPLCGNIFSLLDGTRTCTHNPDCPCPGMPQTVRVTRAVREITRLAEETLPSAERVEFRTAHGAACPCPACVSIRAYDSSLCARNGIGCNTCEPRRRG